ncbi:MAG: hypothetical protein ACRBK7_07730 [Acidimicrobiales bacterium]
MASAQLQLITTERIWKLDRQTVAVGRAGIAQARAALEAASDISDTEGQLFDYAVGRQTTSSNKPKRTRVRTTSGDTSAPHRAAA